jgi:hypothetical protein
VPSLLRQVFWQFAAKNAVLGEEISLSQQDREKFTHFLTGRK